jgi:neopullulanase
VNIYFSAGLKIKEGITFLHTRIYTLLILLILIPISVFSQKFSIQKVEPPNWWAGMKQDTLQLMFYGNDIQGADVSINSDKIFISKKYQTQNPNYLFLDIVIPEDAEPGESTFIFKNDNKIYDFTYSILKRENDLNSHKGFSNEDVIYLIFADRFCDGNPYNNTIDDSLDEFTSADIDGRKGGDIEGIISKLDYLKDFGITSIWVTPMLENNMWMSYHGYAATDLYKIDPRFGSNELYKEFVKDAHNKGLKIILDHVSNHIGINHPWIKNLPMDSWINGTPENHLSGHHDKMASLDIHGDSSVATHTQKGWFTDYMPDLNQQNEFVKKYLIQNTIWWVEYSGLDGIREDTYPYSDQKYLSEWAQAILNEYPQLNIVGEIWQGTPSIISGYQSHSPIRKNNFDSNLPVVTDFALNDAIRNYLSGDKNIYPVYETICQDIVYSNPDNLLVFFDNHDIQRAMYIANGNIEKVKLALNLVLFTRGIPVILYGTEIGIKGGKKDGELRQPFPGGFSGDERNAFTNEGRTETENDIYNYLSELLELRKEYPVLAKGKLRHILKDDIYYLIKTFEDEKALIILNTGEEENTINISQLKNIFKNSKLILNLKTNLETSLYSDKILNLKGYSSQIFLIKK